MGAKPKATYLEARKEVVHAYSTHDKVREFFNCPPETSLQDGLNRMAVWARKAGSRQGKPFSGIEIERELPPSWKRLIG